MLIRRYLQHRVFGARPAGLKNAVAPVSRVLPVCATARCGARGSHPPAVAIGPASRLAFGRPSHPGAQHQEWTHGTTAHHDGRPGGTRGPGAGSLAAVPAARGSSVAHSVAKPRALCRVGCGLMARALVNFEALANVQFKRRFSMFSSSAIM